MTSTDPIHLTKRVNDSAKKSPLKVVSPILKKYTGHRQGKIKNKLKFPRVLHGGRTKQKKQIKPQFKTILPKANAGNVIILEPELLPCALNLLKRKRKDDADEIHVEQMTENDGKPENLQLKECNNKINKSKVVSNNKKKLKCMKNLEACLELLESNTSVLKEKREQAFAENYLLRVQQRLKEGDENLYNQFLDLICTFQINRMSVCDLYKKVKSLFASHSDLIEDFVAFLTPEQAVECGVFMDHLLLTTMSDFLNMIDIYFAKSPHQIKKIHSVLESLATKPNINTESVINTVLPLLKGNPVLKDYFVHLLPNMRPPDNFCTDYEEVEYSELNSDVSDDEEIMETIHLPEVEDLYGGDLCPCDCHEKTIKVQGQHCVSCSLKFINGKVFIQNGKLLRPARVVFSDYDMNYHRERLAPKLYPKRNKKKHRPGTFKDNLSPTKSCNLSSDEFKSDIEEEDKGRFKSGNLKSPRINRKKSVSPKHNDKTLSKCILMDLKLDQSDCEEKCVVGKSVDLSLGKDEEKLSSRLGTDFDFQHKNEPNDFCILLTEQTKKQSEPEETDGSAEKLMNLPKIDSEDDSHISVKPADNQDLVTNCIVKSQALTFLDRERSNSPPVISIPETSNSTFANSKPILSLLENLDDTKNSPVFLDSVGDQNTTTEESFKKELKDVKKEEVNLPWKIEEDRVILQTLQVEKNCEETFMKIGKNIPTRRVEDIKKRFDELMNMLYEMKAKTGNS